MTLRVTVIRHGNTDANNEGWLQGQFGKVSYLYCSPFANAVITIDTHLNSNGLNQAKSCGYRFQNESYDHAYCSDLTRCKQVWTSFFLRVYCSLQFVRR